MLSIVCSGYLPPFRAPYNSLEMFAQPAGFDSVIATSPARPCTGRDMTRQLESSGVDRDLSTSTEHAATAPGCDLLSVEMY